MAEQGRAVWHELMTTDLEKSIGYYKALFGWATEDSGMGEAGTYKMINVAGTNIGGFMPLDQSRGVPSHWIAYVTVDDVDAAANRVSELGGKVEVPPTDIPEVGRFALIAGPEGAHISPYKGLSETPEPEGPPAPGTFVWNELLTTDVGASETFYTGVFGWSKRTMDMGEMGEYHIFQRGEKDAAGMMRMPPEAGGPSLWLPYVGVADVDATAAKVEELGGKVYVPPRDIPAVGRFSVTGDTTGASIALFKPEG